MKENRQHNYGIDLLRFVAMFFVVTLHILGRGGVLQNVSGLNYCIGWLLEVIAFCAVDCYAMISGYVGYSEEERSYKYSRIVVIWIQIVFYNLITTTVGIITKIIPFSFSTIIKCFFPICTNEYWYFTAYVVLFLFIPLINVLLRGLSDKKLTYMVVLLLSVFSVFATIISPFADPLQIENGYSFVWLMICYIVGGWMKKCDIPSKIDINKCFCLLGIFIVITFGFKVAVDNLISAYSYYSTWLLVYISPTVLGMAMMYICMFSKTNINKKACGIIKLFTPCVFGVYLLQENPVIREVVVTDKYMFVANLPALEMLLLILAIAIIQFVLGIGIDYIRLKIFEVCRISQRLLNIEKKIKDMTDLIRM